MSVIHTFVVSVENVVVGIPKREIVCYRRLPVSMPALGSFR